MRDEARRVAMAAKGFLPEADGERLFDIARTASALGPCVEIGSYCGKSAIFIGEGCRARGERALFSVDHHRGSEEQQPGEEYFDAELFDPALGRVNTLPHFLANIRRADLDRWVFPIIGDSAAVAASWSGAVGMLFIDGGHAKPTVEADAEGWSRFVAPGGWLCFHDVFPDPADGGQAPYEVFEMLRARREWTFYGLYGSLGVLRRQ